MKQILFAIAFLSCLTASAQHDYISSSGNVYLESGATERFGSPDIYVTHSTQLRDGDTYWIATLSLFATGTTTGVVKTWQYEFDEATIDALTPTGATTTEDMKNVILQAVEARLITETGSDIFTLH